MWKTPNNCLLNRDCLNSFRLLTWKLHQLVIKFGSWLTQWYLGCVRNNNHLNRCMFWGIVQCLFLKVKDKLDGFWLKLLKTLGFTFQYFLPSRHYTDSEPRDNHNFNYLTTLSSKFSNKRHFLFSTLRSSFDTLLDECMEIWKWTWTKMCRIFIRLKYFPAIQAL